MALNVEAEINWQDYLAIVIRRRWFFIVPCVVIVAVSMVVGLFLPKIYRAKAILLVQDPKIMNPLMQGMAVSSPVETRMRLVQQELLGWTSINRLAHELGLDQGAKSDRELERIIGKLRKDIQVSLQRGGLLTLSYLNEDPALSQRALNAITEIYVKRNVESQTAEAETAIRFIESEMEVYKKQLESSEQALREFKELYAVEMPVATQLNNQIIGLEVKLARLLVDNTDEHPIVVQLRRQIHELKLKRNEEIKRVIAATLAKSQNPDIYRDFLKAVEQPASASAAPAPVVKSSTEAYHAWVSWLDNPAQPKSDAASAQPAVEIAVAQQAAQALPGETAVVPEATEDIGPMALTLAPRQEQELARLKRNYDVHHKTYQEMQRRLERARITQRLGESDESTKFKVIEPARLPLKPVSPNLWLLFTSSLAAGVCVGVCAVFAAEYLDQSFQTAEEVQAALALPVIGSISTIVTEGDISSRQRRYKSWMSVRDQLERVKTRVIRPVWSRVDRALLRWGL